MRRVFEHEQMETNQKDAMIASLRNELYELQDRSHEFIHLENEAANIESKYSLLQQQREHLENDHKIKLEMSRQTTTELRTEIDSIHLQIHKYAVALQEISRSIVGVKRACETTDSEISALMKTNQQTNGRSERLGEQNRNRLNQIKSLKEERNRLDGECERQFKTLEESLALLKILERDARTLEATNSKLENILNCAERDHTELVGEMNNREEMMNSAQKKLKNLNLEIEGLREKTLRLERDCNKGEQQHRTVADNLEAMMTKNKQQARGIKESDNELRAIENELDRALIEHDGLERQHAELSAEHRMINEDIDVVFEQIAQYQKMNNQLQREVEHYVVVDEEARSRLNRKEGMVGLLETVTRQLGQTADNIAHLR